MYCKNCGNEVAPGCYCTYCGTRAGESTEIVVAEPLTDAQRLKKAFSSKLFLTVAILTSVSLGISVLGILFFSFYGTVMSVFTYSVEFAIVMACVLFGMLVPSIALSIVQTVGYWKAYRRNKGDGALDASGIKILYVHIRIVYVLVWISNAFVFLAGVICIAAAMLAAPELIIGEIAVLIILGVVFIVIAAVYTVLQILYNRKVKMLFKQLVSSAESGVLALENLKSIHTWMLVIGIIEAVGGLSSGGATLATAAAKICLSFWIRENFLKDA